MKIIVAIGNRDSDRVHLEIEDITDAVEVYGKAEKATGNSVTAALILEKVDNGEFEIE